MTDRLEIPLGELIELKKQLVKIDWRIGYGAVKIQIRQGKPTLVTIERTIKLD